MCVAERLPYRARSPSNRFLSLTRRRARAGTSKTASVAEIKKHRQEKEKKKEQGKTWTRKSDRRPGLKNLDKHTSRACLEGKFRTCPRRTATLQTMTPTSTTWIQVRNHILRCHTYLFAVLMGGGMITIRGYGGKHWYLRCSSLLWETRARVLLWFKKTTSTFRCSENAPAPPPPIPPPPQKMGEREQVLTTRRRKRCPWRKDRPGGWP